MSEPFLDICDAIQKLRCDMKSLAFKMNERQRTVGGHEWALYPDRTNYYKFVEASELLLEIKTDLEEGL